MAGQWNLTPFVVNLMNLTMHTACDLGIGGSGTVIRPPRLMGLEYSDNSVAFNFGPPTPIDTPVLENPHHPNLL